MERVVQFIKKIYTLFYRNMQLEEIQSCEFKQESCILEEEVVNNDETLEFEREDNILEEVTEDASYYSIAVERFKQIDRGDIIYAKRVDKGLSNELLKGGHEFGPFLVIENLGDRLVCFYGSSHCVKKQNRLIIDHQNYDGLTKKTCFRVATFYEIGLDSYRRKLDTLNVNDEHIFQKKINILARNNSLLKKYGRQLPLESGDIFRFCKELYLLYKLENNVITAIQVSTTDVSDYSFISDYNAYYIHFDHVIEIPNNLTFSPVDFITKDIYDRVLVLFKKYLMEKDKQNIIQRGSVIKYENKVLYIYSQEADSYLGYRIYGFSSDDKFPIFIHHKKYSADFEDVYKIQKDDHFKIIITISEEEIDYNKQIKKSYNKMKSKEALEQQFELTKNKNLSKKKIQDGVIVSDKTLMHTEYLVLERNQDELLTVLFENDKCYFVYLDVRQVRFERKLERSQFKEILVHIRENHPNYNRYISEKKLLLTINKYSNNS